MSDWPCLTFASFGPSCSGCRSDWLRIYRGFSESDLLYWDQMSEAEIVKRAQAGDFEAFTELVNAHKDKLYAFVRKLTGDPDDTNDIVQDTFLKAIDKIDQFRGEASFGTWLTSIALNQARALFAKRKQGEMKPIEAYLPVGATNGEHPLAEASLFDWEDPLANLERAEIGRLIEEGLETIPFAYREAFLLRYVEEMSVKEVAATIGQTVAATKSRILRARLALRDFLSKRFEAKYGEKVRRIH
ncbi:sigma-70 family RNA polymerase sigma factor [candidate division GN15 bacterium]|nr:sigma-70 family RNA polymerase sigma factor [candidate division GN15 bacterium]